MKNPLHNFFLISTCAWIQKGDKFLIAKRSLDDDYKPWERSLPGGKLERNLEEKALEKNVAKEIEEEVGLKVHSDMIFLNNYTFQAKKIYAIRLIFLCQRKSEKAQALEDTDAVKWQTIDELKSNKDLPKWMQREMVYLEAYFVNRKK